MRKIISGLMAVLFVGLLGGCSAEKSVEGQAVADWKTTAAVTKENIQEKGISNEQGLVMASQNRILYEEQAEELCELINEYRLENGLDLLRADDTLTQIAMHRAAENAYMNWMEVLEDETGTHHLRPDGSSIAELFRYYGKYGNYGEILGRRQQSAWEVFEDWKMSPEHDACMKNGEFEEIGTGMAKADNGDYYYAVVFLKEIQ